MKEINIDDIINSYGVPFLKKASEIKDFRRVINVINHFSILIGAGIGALLFVLLILRLSFPALFGKSNGKTLLILHSLITLMITALTHVIGMGVHISQLRGAAEPQTVADVDLSGLILGWAFISLLILILIGVTISNWSGNPFLETLFLFIVASLMSGFKNDTLRGRYGTNEQMIQGLAMPVVPIVVLTIVYFTTSVFMETTANDTTQDLKLSHPKTQEAYIPRDIQRDIPRDIPTDYAGDPMIVHPHLPTNKNN